MKQGIILVKRSLFLLFCDSIEGIGEPKDNFFDIALGAYVMTSLKLRGLIPNQSGPLTLKYDTTLLNKETLEVTWSFTRAPHEHSPKTTATINDFIN